MKLRHKLSFVIGGLIGVWLAMHHLSMFDLLSIFGMCLGLNIFLNYLTVWRFK